MSRVVGGPACNVKLRIDHVSVGGADLDRLRGAFADAGLPSDYGGPHSNGRTHMAVIGFGDGSYIELISTLEPGAESPVWDRHIRGDGGPAAWAVRSDDVAADAERLRRCGIPVEGPSRWSRRRPDGTVLEWDLAFIGEGPPGSVLPFVIRDRTPRSLRAPPTRGVAGTGLTGVAAVVIGVPDLEGAADLFRRAYGWEEPAPGETGFLGARTARFQGTPAVLAAPASDDGWLADRLASFGPSPCAFLLGSRDADASRGRLAPASEEEWDGGTVLWLPPDRLAGCRVGILT